MIENQFYLKFSLKSGFELVVDPVVKIFWQMDVGNLDRYIKFGSECNRISVYTFWSLRPILLDLLERTPQSASFQLLC